MELTKYLASVTLSHEELDRLRKTAWLLKAGEATEGRRYCANQLYDPALSALGLDLLDWSSPKSQIKWRPQSDEAKFLYSLGLNRSPSLEKLLSIAATDSPHRLNAYNYFLTEFNAYSTVYDPSRHALAFIPALRSNVYYQPLQIYINPAVAVLGFPVFAGDALAASKLRLLTDPATTLLLERLLTLLPMEPDQAKRVFNYLATQGSRKFIRVQMFAPRG